MDRTKGRECGIHVMMSRTYPHTWCHHPGNPHGRCSQSRHLCFHSQRWCHSCAHRSYIRWYLKIKLNEGVIETHVGNTGYSIWYQALIRHQYVMQEHTYLVIRYDRTGSVLAQVMACSRRHQTITWTNVDLSSVRSSDNHLRAISQEIP